MEAEGINVNDNKSNFITTGKSVLGCRSVQIASTSFSTLIRHFRDTVSIQPINNAGLQSIQEKAINIMEMRAPPLFACSTSFVFFTSALNTKGLFGLDQVVAVCLDHEDTQDEEETRPGLLTLSWNQENKRCISSYSSKCHVCNSVPIS